MRLHFLAMRIPCARIGDVWIFGDRAVLLLIPRRRLRLTNFDNDLFSRSDQEKVAGDILDRRLSQRRLC